MSGYLDKKYEELVAILDRLEARVDRLDKAADECLKRAKIVYKATEARK